MDNLIKKKSDIFYLDSHSLLLTYIMAICRWAGGIQNRVCYHPKKSAVPRKKVLPTLP